MLDQTSIFDFVEDNHYSYDKVLAHKRPIKLFEAFAGVGCQRMALKRLNIEYESVGISEIDKYALLAYEAIHGDCRNYGDITKMTYIPDCDIFTWSFPCTDLSKAGKQKGLIKGEKIQEIDMTVFTKEHSYKFFDEMAIELSQEELYGNIAFYQNDENPFIIEHGVNIAFGISATEQMELPKEMKKEVIKILQNRLLKLEGKEGTRSGLVYEVLRLLRVTENKPKVLIMENVVDLVQVKFAPQFYEIQKELEKLGYQNYTQVLNGKDYGVAQNRERVFMVSILGGGRYEFPLREVLTKRLKDYLEPVVDEKYYLSDRQIGLIHASTFRTTQSRIQDDDICDTLCARDYKDPKCVQVAQLDGFESNGRIYSNEGLSPTINTMGGGNRQPKIIENFYQDREPREYEEYSPTLRADRSGLMVIEPSVSTAITTSFNPFVAIPASVRGRVQEDGKSKQKLEIREDSDVSNALTTVQKDSLVVIVPEATKKGYAEAHDGMIQTIKTSGDDVGVVVDTYNKKVLDNQNVIGTITANTGTYGHCGNFTLNNGLRIRKLTPKECWRLMGISDEDFYKAQAVVSNSQLYKIAGNGIIIDVFEKILKGLT